MATEEITKAKEAFEEFGQAATDLSMWLPLAR